MSKRNEADSPESVARVVEKVSKIVSEMAGIQLGPKQHSMVENRLKSRIVKLGLADMSDYLQYLEAHRESESQALLSLLTTHHTYFFREFTQFEFLLENGMEPLIKAARQRPDRTLHVWSAACSRGQEVYSLAMFFQHHLQTKAPDCKVKVHGTDVDPDSVAIARNAVYKNEELKSVPTIYSQQNWILGQDKVSGFSKAAKRIRENCTFDTLNLFKIKQSLGGKKFDLIFCRNVFIYFNQEQIKQVTQDLLSCLEPHGFLCVGVSESLSGLGLNAQGVGPSIYCHPRSEATPRPVAAPVNKVLEVLCVDDSPTIHALFSKILISEHGFKIGAKAKNGKEALEILKTRTFDAITLDLHMPEMDGVSFLENWKDRNAPVLIVSAIQREQQEQGQKALKLGAYDYVEKPSLENLAQAGNEIRMKLKLGVQGFSAKGSKPESATATIKPKSAPPQRTAPVIEKNTAQTKIKVLVVDDSATIRQVLRKIIEGDREFELVGETDKPLEVPSLIEKLKPDVMTLDIQMPQMDGVTLLKKVFPVYHTPTVMISSISMEEGPQVLEALESGAVDYIQKPSFAELASAGPQIRDRLKVAAGARVRKRAASPSTGPISLPEDRLILMGASTGGTEALRVVLEGLRPPIPAILIVQHIPPVFSKAFADRLNTLLPFEVREAKNGDLVQPGTVLVAPGAKQMALKWRGDKVWVEVNDDGPMNRHKPSVDYLFKSAVGAPFHDKMAAVLLTGMGADGAAQMKVLRDCGVRTIAQDEATSVVYGMPREAARMGAAEKICGLHHVPETLKALFSTQVKKAA